MPDHEFHVREGKFSHFAERANEHRASLGSIINLQNCIVMYFAY